LINIVLLATAWGPRFGGINAFNQDFAAGLKVACSNDIKIFCAVPNATVADKADAKSRGIEIISIDEAGHASDFDRNWTHDVFKKLKTHNAESGLIWVGHDVKSGFAANYAAAEHGGISALIMHMDYIAYQGVIGDGEAAWDKHESQQRLFRAPATLFAVGPLLKRSCDRISGQKRTTSLVPGFPQEVIDEFKKRNITEAPSETKRFPSINTSPDDLVAAITLGRMDQKNDRLKQGRLAIAAFSRAFALARSIRGPEALTRGYMSIIGVDADLESRKALFRGATEYESQIVNLLPAVYSEDREYTMSRLKNSNLALVLSWHEGFGLTAWEAIANEVPLILSRNSGIFQMIDEELGGAGVGCLHGVQIDGSRSDEQNYSNKDERRIAKKILRISSDLRRAKRDAFILKQNLIENLECSWENTGRQFITALLRNNHLSGREVLASVRRTEAESSERIGSDAPPSLGNPADTSETQHFEYEQNALADKLWLASGRNVGFDKVITKLKSHNWYSQNPQFVEVRRLLKESGSNISDFFVLGRNIYQSACGGAKEAEIFLKNLVEELDSVSNDIAFALFHGICFEIYFGPDGNPRSEPKTDCITEVFKAAEHVRLRTAVEWINEKIKSIFPAGRYPVLLGDFKPCSLIFRLREPGSNEMLWSLQELVLNGVVITEIRVGSKNVFPSDIIRGWGDVLYVQKMIELVSRHFAVPMVLIVPNIEKNVEFRISSNVHFKWDSSIDSQID
jgi:glycosyltransferase involved in cell wall biosynthesis